MKYQVFYSKPQYFRDLIGGSVLNSDIWNNVSRENFTNTHTHVTIIEANNIDDVFDFMQAINWVNSQENSNHIKSLGLNHTSMSVGDIVWVPDKKTGYLCDNTSWREL